jgi:methylase of polypeptide subunit release factors
MIDPRPNPDALLGLTEPLLARLRASTDVGFHAGLIAEVESIAPRQFDAVRLPLVHAWLRSRDGVAAIWARLFAYRDAVRPEIVTELLGEQLAAALRDAGALRPDQELVRSSLRLMPFAELLLASDEVDAREDPVMGPGATTLELWRAMSVEPGTRVLDIGCGAGSLALAAVRAGAGEVVGVDLDARAVAYARFNAKLNRIERTRFEVGDLAAPVVGERFDLVVSQPPFVMQPPSLTATTYLHGGRRGDELTHRMLGMLPPLLGEHGRALVLFDTADDDALMDRIATALGDAPLRIIAVAAAGLDAEQQALGYAAATHAQLGPEYAAAAIAYREHLRELGIERTRHVLLALERVDDARPRFAARVEPRSAQPVDAAELAQLRAALDAAARPDTELLRSRVCVSPHAWLVHERALRPSADEADADERLRVHFAGGRALDRELTPAAAALIEILADTDSLAEAIERYAEACEASPAEVAAGVARFVRDSLVSGLLTIPPQPVSR